MGQLPGDHAGQLGRFQRQAVDGGFVHAEQVAAIAELLAAAQGIVGANQLNRPGQGGVLWKPAGERGAGGAGGWIDGCGLAVSRGGAAQGDRNRGGDAIDLHQALQNAVCGVEIFAHLPAGFGVSICGLCGSSRTQCQVDQGCSQQHCSDSLAHSRRDPEAGCGGFHYQEEACSCHGDGFGFTDGFPPDATPMVLACHR